MAIAALSVALNIQFYLKLSASEEKFSQFIDREQQMRDIRLQTLSMMESQTNYLRRQNRFLENKNWVLNRDSKRTKYLAQLKRELAKRNALYGIGKETNQVRVGSLYVGEETINN